MLAALLLTVPAYRTWIARHLNIWVWLAITAALVALARYEPPYERHVQSFLLPWLLVGTVLNPGWTISQTLEIGAVSLDRPALVQLIHLAADLVARFVASESAISAWTVPRTSAQPRSDLWLCDDQLLPHRAPSACSRVHAWLERQAEALTNRLPHLCLKWCLRASSLRRANEYMIQTSYRAVSSGLEQVASPGPDATFASRPLKVCLASMAPFVGGAEVAVERLAIGLREFGYEVFLLLGRSGPVQKRLELVGLRCTVLRMYHTDKWNWPRYWLARRALSQELRREQPDIVHSNDLPTHQIISDAARGLGVPRICHHRFPFPGAAIDWLNKYGAERHLFVSRALMNENCAASALLQASPGAVVYDGLQLPPLPTAEARSHARSRLCPTDDRPMVLFAGQIIERKGVADLIRAWSLLEANVRGSVQLVIVGDDVAGSGAYRVAMVQLARKVGCPARFVGFQKEVGEWLLAADIAVVPSHVEPLGNATLEAMSYGLPVIGGDVGGIPEMVLHERTGLLIPPTSPARLAEALHRMILDPQERQRFGAAGRKRCEELFSLRAHAQAVGEEYRIALQTTGNVGAVAAS